MSEVSISVITVCRNAAKELPGAAASVLDALSSGDEWVVQDGASTDETASFFAGLSDERVLMESRPDNGIYDAMNRAADRASGDFVLFLGADDRLRITMNDIRSRLQDAQTVYYGDVWRSASQDRYAGPFNAAKLARTNICHQAVFYPRAAFRNRCFDEQYPFQADWVFNMNCFADDSLRFEYMDVIVADYAQGGASSMKMDEAFQRDYRHLLRRYFSFSDRWLPSLASFGSKVFRSLPGVAAPVQTPARKR